MTPLHFSHPQCRSRKLGGGCGRLGPDKPDRGGGPKRHHSPAQLRAPGGAREDGRKLAGEAEIDGPEDFSGHWRAVGSAGGGAEEGSRFGGELQREELSLHACHGVERSVSVPSGSESDRSVFEACAVDLAGP
ncbi:hypothetical protein LOK49_LG01G00971 [Camellia lanceoleosa]|uniref:Uncharacterized protein n=1 Tax=Camellia lanceoleosa TaxID=1840588 RepID=A0ACC0J5A2_9ERIC|nr:hypothetical protein LOK49_LG01G00971 [Camellia lanceoleosa]